MSYFPESLMPLSPKQNVSKFTATNVLISADDYNLHDQEIRAIEEYLGKVGGFAGLGLSKGNVPELKVFGNDPTSSAPDQRGSDTELPDPTNGNMLNSIAKLVDITNNITGYAAQGSSSGYLHSGQRVIFPEQIHATYLTSRPGTYDSAINVNSTAGFPRQGVISILNDVQQGVKGKSSDAFVQNVFGGISTLEWIKYSNKNDKQFLDCERGFLNTNVGPHTASFNAPKETDSNKNMRDFCVPIDGVDLNVCGREWPWWRQRRRYRMPFFAVQGSWRDLVTYIVRYGARHPLRSDNDPVCHSTLPGDCSTVPTMIVQAATDCNLLVERSGVSYLQSQNPSNVEKKRIGWVEASTFVSKIETYGLVEKVNGPEDFPVGTIPVFSGRLTVNYGLSALTRTTNYEMDAIQILQTADARVFCFMSDTKNRDRTLQAIVNFETYFVGPVMTSELRNSV